MIEFSRITMKVLLIIANILTVVYSHSSEDGFHFQCNTPDDWLARRSIYPGQLWPNGTVTYELHSSLTPDDITEVYRAFVDIQSKTCIRFIPRPVDETSYVSIENDENTCGVAHVCRTGGYQFARFGGGCRFANVMIHELGHTLCLGHEQTRIDRDDFVHFDPCAAGEVPGRDDFETRGHFYDYTSQMHYQCGWCPGGWPKMENVQKCGLDVQQGLSVMDADKINDFYDCKGCLSHRWRRIENLSETDKQELVSFGESTQGQPLYLCRTYAGGEMVPGSFNATSNTCSVSFNGTEIIVSERAQVFVVPNGNNVGSYRPFPNTKSAGTHAVSLNDLVPVGRTPNGVSEYAAIASISEGSSTVFAIGKVYEYDLGHAYVPYQGKEVVVSDFEFIGCN